LAGFAASHLRDTFAGVALTSEAPGLVAGLLHQAGWIAIALAAVMAMMTWRWVFAFTGSAAAATFAWVCVFLGAPFFFTSISSYPDIPAAFCVMVAVAWRTTPQRRETPWMEYLIRGLAVSALPWLSAAYIPMAVIIAVLLGVRAVRDSKAYCVLVPVTVERGPPVAVVKSISPFGNPLVGLFGLLFDQQIRGFHLCAGT
jgi:hypothetical protein